MLTNPYVLAAAAFATLGYAIYHVVTVETEAEKVQRKYNEACKAYTEQADNLKKVLQIYFQRYAMRLLQIMRKS